LRFRLVRQTRVLVHSLLTLLSLSTSYVEGLLESRSLENYLSRGDCTSVCIRHIRLFSFVFKDTMNPHLLDGLLRLVRNFHCCNIPLLYKEESRSLFNREGLQRSPQIPSSSNTKLCFGYGKNCAFISYRRWPLQRQIFQVKRNDLIFCLSCTQFESVAINKREKFKKIEIWP